MTKQGTIPRHTALVRCVEGCEAFTDLAGHRGMPWKTGSVLVVTGLGSVRGEYDKEHADNHPDDPLLHFINARNLADLLAAVDRCFEHFGEPLFEGNYFAPKFQTLGGDEFLWATAHNFHSQSTLHEARRSRTHEAAEHWALTAEDAKQLAEMTDGNKKLVRAIPLADLARASRDLHNHGLLLAYLTGKCDKEFVADRGRLLKYLTGKYGEQFETDYIEPVSAGKGSVPNFRLLEPDERRPVYSIPEEADAHVVEWNEDDAGHVTGRLEKAQRDTWPFLFKGLDWYYYDRLCGKDVEGAVAELNEHEAPEYPKRGTQLPKRGKLREEATVDYLRWVFEGLCCYPKKSGVHFERKSGSKEWSVEKFEGTATKEPPLSSLWSLIFDGMSEAGGDDPALSVCPECGRIFATGRSDNTFCCGNCATNAGKKRNG